MESAFNGSKSDAPLAPRRVVALVTGAAGGLGAAIIKRFVHEGFVVAAVDINPPGDELSAIEGTHWWQCDVSDHHQVNAVVGQVEDRLGSVDICIANAGIVSRSPVLDITPASWQEVLDVNLSGSFFVAQACAQIMAKRQNGRIVIMSSWVQDVPVYALLPYCVTKAGINMLVKGMALELAQYGIRVNGVAPGSVDAGLTGKKMAQDAEHRTRVLRDIPLGELQSPESVADAVYFLSSPAASYVTGTTLLVDGGNSLYYRRLLDLKP